MAKFCIYSLTCRHTGDVYVGRTSKLKRRLSEHAAESRVAETRLISREVQQYGIESFDVGVLRRVATKAEALLAEREFITLMKPRLNQITPAPARGVATR